MLTRTPLNEFYRRIIREDMITLFSRTANFESLECSFILPGDATNELKYRTACILEIITGQKMHIRESCMRKWEDPFYKPTSDQSQKSQIKIKTSIMRKQTASSKNKTIVNSLSVSDYKKLSNVIKIEVNLSKLTLFDFLEKAREFYLPDVLNIENKEKLTGEINRGFNNNRIESNRSLILKRWQKWTLSKMTIYPPRHPIGIVENPLEACTALSIKAMDLIKFPDLELHFESIGKSLNDDNSLDLILRPTISIQHPWKFDRERDQPIVDNVKVMNYLLSVFFNQYMNRPKLQFHK